MMDDLLGEYVQVTHEGWRIWQTALSRLAWFLFSSILVPVAVSAVTALIALWIADGLRESPQRAENDKRCNSACKNAEQYSQKGLCQTAALSFQTLVCPYFSPFIKRKNTELS